MPNTSSAPLPDQARRIFASAFMMAFSLGIWWVSLPFIIKYFHGSDADVGTCFALHMGVYVCGCLLTGSLLHHWNPKNIVLLGTAIIFLLALTLCFAVTLPISPDLPGGRNWLIIGLFVAIGLPMSFFWPFLMGWLSTGHEGPALSRRLGLHNFSWAGGSLISPLLGGYLVKQSPLLPLLVPVVCLFLCFIFAYSAPSPPHSSTSPARPKSLPADFNIRLLPLFRWTSCVALLCSFLCAGVIRTHMGLLLKFHLHFPNAEFDFGLVVMFFALANFLVLTAAGRRHFWHFRFSFLIVAQILVLASPLLIILFQRLEVFIVALILNGAGMAFSYSSHQYYGVSGSTRRSALMALHEIILSVGLIIGCFMAGLLSEFYSPYSPYFFAVGAMIVGLVIQVLICLIWLIRSGKSLPSER